MQKKRIALNQRLCSLFYPCPSSPICSFIVKTLIVNFPKDELPANYQSTTMLPPAAIPLLFHPLLSALEG